MELNVERLLGTKVRDREGKVLGRIEEIRAERRDDALYVEAYMVDAAIARQSIGSRGSVGRTRFIRPEEPGVARRPERDPQGAVNSCYVSLRMETANPLGDLLS